MNFWIIYVSVVFILCESTSRWNNSSRWLSQSRLFQWPAAAERRLAPCRVSSHTPQNEAWIHFTSALISLSFHINRWTLCCLSVSEILVTSSTRPAPLLVDPSPRTASDPTSSISISTRRRHVFGSAHRLIPHLSLCTSSFVAGSTIVTEFPVVATQAEVKVVDEDWDIRAAGLNWFCCQSPFI